MPRKTFVSQKAGFVTSPLVHGGHAEALDDECQEAADRKDRESPDQKGVLREVYDRMINEQEEFREQVKEFESGDD